MWRTCVQISIVLFLTTQRVQGDKDIYFSNNQQDESGSGSGGNADDEDFEKPIIGTTPNGQFTRCQHERLYPTNTNFVPNCTWDGHFTPRQCRRTEGCWCVTRDGVKIPGSYKFGDMTKEKDRPDCTDGTNIPQCSKKLIRYHWNEVKPDYKPACTIEGQFKPRQCNPDKTCWCVSKYGEVILNSSHPYHENVNCMRRYKSTTSYTTDKPLDSDISLEETGQKNTIDGSDIYGENRDFLDIDSREESKEGDKPGDTYEIGNMKQETTQGTTSLPLTKQPGILAGIIAGALVGLLCIILLLVFIICRLRTSSEGSYTLNEATKARGSYAYQKASEKEFFA